MKPALANPDTSLSSPPDYAGNVSLIQPNSTNCYPNWQRGKTVKKATSSVDYIKKKKIVQLFPELTT